jgi:hypothetical protein
MAINNSPFGIPLDRFAVYSVLDLWGGRALEGGGLMTTAEFAQQCVTDLGAAIAKTDQPVVAQIGTGFKDVAAAVVAGVHANSMPNLQNTLAAFETLVQQQSPARGAEASPCSRRPRPPQPHSPKPPMSSRVSRARAAPWMPYGLSRPPLRASRI